MERSLTIKLEGKVALVTGGGKGLGRAISLAFAREGADVAMAARTKSPLEETAEEIRKMGRRAYPFVADISDEDQVNEFVSSAVSYLGRIDILVNNTGIAGPTVPVANLAMEDWDRVLAVNLTGAYLCAKAALKHMIKNKSGNILNISSTAGIKGLWRRAPYVVSKSGILGLTKTLALEVGVHGIRVNAICPGPVEGERMDRVFRARAKAMGISPDMARKRAMDEAALRRLVSPEEVARTAVFLASSDSEGITGQVIRVDAGIEKSRDLTFSRAPYPDTCTAEPQRYGRQGLFPPLPNQR
ncbi:SDR family oxidoreductase [Candidatus Aerophobetes bacterium]|nr:SDR family oxidoreductase [Candidatus Aerophobetes bacterium]